MYALFGTDRVILPSASVTGTPVNALPSTLIVTLCPGIGLPELSTKVAVILTEPFTYILSGSATTVKLVFSNAMFVILVSLSQFLYTSSPSNVAVMFIPTVFSGV